MVVAESRITLVGWPARGAALGQAGADLGQKLTAAAGQIAAELRVVAVNESPTGKTAHSGPRFRDSWVTEIAPEGQGGVRIRLGNTDPKTRLVIGPTRPHLIAATHAIATGPRAGQPGYLRFEIGGQALYRHQIHHPGTALNDIPGRVDAAMQPRYQQIVEQQGLEFLARVSSIFT